MKTCEIIIVHSHNVGRYDIALPSVQKVFSVMHYCKRVGDKETNLIVP